MEKVAGGMASCARCGMSLEVKSFELPPIGTQCYVLISAERRELAVFDAPLNAWQTVERLLVAAGHTLAGLYFTHGHWDHTLDGARFNEQGVPVYAGKGDEKFYHYPATMAAFAIPGMEMPPVSVDHWLADGDQLEILGAAVEVRHVPGHSAGSILYWFKEQGFAVAGDALFAGSIGRTDFPGCSFEQLEQSIRTRIYTLPDETQIYPGHGPATSVGREALSNPFVKR